MTLLEHKEIYSNPNQHTAQSKSIDVLCRGKTDLFFSERTKDMQAAQAICLSCPNQSRCLSEAREDPPYAGVWGGVIFVDGEELLFKRGRGRPSKKEQSENNTKALVLGVRQIA